MASLTVSLHQGWQCPNCKKCHAPWVASCDCHKQAVELDTLFDWVKTSTQTVDWTPNEATSITGNWRLIY